MVRPSVSPRHPGIPSPAPVKGGGWGGGGGGGGGGHIIW